MIGWARAMFWIVDACHVGGMLFLQTRFCFEVCESRTQVLVPRSGSMSIFKTHEVQHKAAPVWTSGQASLCHGRCAAKILRRHHSCRVELVLLRFISSQRNTPQPSPAHHGPLVYLSIFFTGQTNILRGYWREFYRGGYVHASRHIPTGYSAAPRALRIE